MRVVFQIILVLSEALFLSSQLEMLRGRTNPSEQLC